MKFATTIVVALISMLFSYSGAGDVEGVPATPENAIGETVAVNDTADEVSDEEEENEDILEAEDDSDEAEEEEDEDEDDPEIAGRKRIAGTLEFCLRDGDMTPVELINCASDILLSGNLSPPPAFSKCVGEYVICTGVNCSAELSKTEYRSKYYAKVYEVRR
ncbi:RNA polymerase sigma factor, putative [Babesia ovata]|uniref:RNA polymerase sigma factor, putative n=1 Tax=Babesia ovata TaxID=189622 RepID=A0A2H6KC34_9APIC|nr:RNA polymerase sigma factor, putative [Babesia ovata]GBE60556.1 RNA polymerase sigma factor, putative [Babesia ovata]